MEIFLDSSYQDELFLPQNLSGSFLQGSYWQDFLQAQGKNAWRLSLKEEDKIIGTCLLVENKLFFGRSYLYAPKGPIFDKTLTAVQEKQAAQLLFSKIRDLTVATKQYQEIFLRLEYKNILDIEDLVKSKDIQPKETWFTDLKKPLAEILQNSHPKTRYNISLAKKKGLEIRFSQDKKDIDIFIDLLSKTAERQKIGVHPDKYFKLWAEKLFGNNFSELAIASINNKPVAANLLLRFADIVTYVHGASDYSQRALMAPYLLHWESIKKYQSQELASYDWWGIAPQDNSKPSWQGISRFKMGFAGSRQVSAGTYDYIYDPAWYKAYNVLRDLRRKIK